MMSKPVGMEVSFAAAEAVRLANVDVIAAYPITPQTHIVERLSQIVADDELDAEYICVESEHSAMSACAGASAAGARAFTATAGQGLELMHEMMYVVSFMRLPVVMAVCNRALSAPLSVWGDHSDAMAVRDCGWIQVFAENGQQVIDLILWAYRVSEDPRVLFPAMVHLDGFHLTHVIEPVVLPDQSLVEEFIPEYCHPFPLDPERPVTMGAYGPPFIYTEAKKAQEVALSSTKSVILEGWKGFETVFGRSYKPVESYRLDDAEVALLTMGSVGETATVAVDRARKKSKKVGLIKLRLWRPFPFEEFKESVKHIKLLIVLDRAISFGGPGGPVASEVRSALYHLRSRPKVVNFVAGLGGRDITPEMFEHMLKRALEILARGQEGGFEIIGVRE